jgi:hypothetical protein
VSSLYGNFSSVSLSEAMNFKAVASLSSLSDTTICDAIGSGTLISNALGGPSFTFDDGAGNIIRLIMVWDSSISNSALLVERQSSVGSWEVLQAHF